MESRNRRGGPKTNNDCARNLSSELHAQNHDEQGKTGEKCGAPVQRRKCLSESSHTVKEIAWDRIEAKAEEIFDLCAGDQNGDAIGKADDDRSRKIFDGRTHARRSEKEQKDARHHRADKEAVDAVLGDDSSDDNDESTGWSANLCFGSAQSGDQESGHDGTVETCLRRKAGGDSECHGQRQSDKAHRDSGDQVRYKFVAVVSAKQDYRFRQPGIEG